MSRAEGDSWRPRDRGGRDPYQSAPLRQRDRRSNAPSRDDRYSDDRYRDNESSMYRFGEPNNYRPAQNARDPYFPPADSSYSNGGGSARRGDRGDFTFRAGQAPPQNYPANNNAASRPQTRRPRNPKRENHNWKKPVAPHARPLFQPRGSTPEQMLGMNEGPTKFLAFDDGSASEGEQSGASEEGEAPTHKKSRVAASAQDDGDSVPKWSNPDPYTVLPPDDPNKKKRKDIVQLIRKAKVSAAEAAAQTNAVADNDDFISLDDIEAAPQVVPTGPAPFSHRNNLHPARTSHAPGSAVEPINAPSLGPPPSLSNQSVPPPPPAQPPPPPPPALVGSLTQVRPVASQNAWPPPTVEAAVPKAPRRKARQDAVVVAPVDQDTTLRSYDQDLTNAQVGIQPKEFQRYGGAPRSFGQESRPHKRKRDLSILGEVIPEWISTAPSGVPAPWTDIDHSRTEDMGQWLSKEICDFYEFVKPRDFEETIRQDLYRRLEACLQRSAQLPEGGLHCFGSYAAGLYLPTADMDLVYISKYHLQGGPPIIDPKAGALLNKVRQDLRRARLADDLELIRFAKVPLIKFVDKHTGVKVDVSFEKVDGLTTQVAFEQWKDEFPIAPALVTLVKQFLLMRGLSEVRDGGLGGFSVICLVVHMLYMLPAVQSKNLVPEDHLGQLFMEFLELYGKKFNLSNTIISMNPPTYLKKEKFGPDGRVSQPDKLTIIDPHRPDNDISGGSNQAKLIFRLFAQAHDDLQKRMAEMKVSRPRWGSILEAVFKGNYTIYTDQRAHLKACHEKMFPRGHQNKGRQNKRH